MNKLQLTVIGAAVVLFLILYIGCETKPSEIQDIEKSRILSSESTDISILREEALSELNREDEQEMVLLEQQAAELPQDSLKSAVYQRLSGRWYELGYPAIAGFYAQQVAELNGTEETWSIAGTTYTLCVQQSEKTKVREFCTGRAVQAFESAISLNPDNIAHRINLALVYTENPPEDNPMKGIMMLVELNREYPESVPVLNNLGRLAIRTGQLDRARQRLEKALSLEPDNTTTNCLLARTYESLGEETLARQFEQKCRSLLN